MRNLGYCALVFVGGLLLVLSLMASAGPVAGQEPTPTPTATPTAAPYVDIVPMNGQEVLFKYSVDLGDFAIVAVLSLQLFVLVLLLVVMTLRKRYQ